MKTIVLQVRVSPELKAKLVERVGDRGISDLVRNLLLSYLGEEPFVEKAQRVALGPGLSENLKEALNKIAKEPKPTLKKEKWTPPEPMSMKGYCPAGAPLHMHPDSCNCKLLGFVK